RLCSENRELQERLMVSEATVHAQAEQLKDYRDLLSECGHHHLVLCNDCQLTLLLQEKLNEMECELRSLRQAAQSQERTIQDLTESIGTKDSEAQKLYQLIEGQNVTLNKLREMAHRNQLAQKGVSESVTLSQLQGELVGVQSSLFSLGLELEASQRSLRQSQRQGDDLARFKDRLNADLQDALQHREETEKHNQDLRCTLQKTRAELRAKEEALKEVEAERLSVAQEKDRSIAQLNHSLREKERQLQEYSQMFETPESSKPRDALLEKLRERIKDRDRALERTIDDKFRCLDEREGQVRTLQLALREKDRDLDRLRCILSNNEETITSLDALVQRKELELEQAAEAYRNLQWLKQESEEKERSIFREKDAIIGQLQAALQARSKEIQDLTATLVARVQAGPTEVVEELKARLQLKEKLFQDLLSDRSRQSSEHQTRVSDLLNTLSHLQGLLREKEAFFKVPLSSLCLCVPCAKYLLLILIDQEMMQNQEEVMMQPSPESEEDMKALQEELQLMLKKEREAQVHVEMRFSFVCVDANPLLSNPCRKNCLLCVHLWLPSKQREQQQQVPRCIAASFTGYVTRDLLKNHLKSHFAVDTLQAQYQGHLHMESKILSYSAQLLQYNYCCGLQVVCIARNLDCSGFESRLGTSWTTPFTFQKYACLVQGLSEHSARLCSENRELQERLMVSEATVHAQAEQLKDYRDLLTETSVQQASKQVQVDLQDLGYETCGRSENEAERDDASSPGDALTRHLNALDSVGGDWYKASRTGRNGGASDGTGDESALHHLVQDLRSQLTRCHKVIRGLQMRVRSLSATSDYASSLERTPRKVSLNQFEGVEEDEGWVSDTQATSPASKPSRELQELMARVATLEAQLSSSKLEGKCEAEQGKCATWPGKYNSLIQAQARELSHLRQRMREGEGVSHILTQHLGDTTKAFEELLRANDVDYYMGQSFREQLSQSTALAQRLLIKLTGRKREQENPQKFLELQQKDQIIESLHNKLQHRPETPSSCQALSETTDPSDRTSLVSDECQTNEDLDLCSELDARDYQDQEEQQQSEQDAHSSIPPPSRGPLQSSFSCPGMLFSASGCLTAPSLKGRGFMTQGLETSPPLVSFLSLDSLSFSTRPNLIEEHLREVRCLRQRLEESIRTNERLRQQLEEKLANTGRDGGSIALMSVHHVSIGFMQNVPSKMVGGLPVEQRPHPLPAERTARVRSRVLQLQIQQRFVSSHSYKCHCDTHPEPEGGTCVLVSGFLCEAPGLPVELGELLSEVRSLRAQLQSSIQENSAFKQLELHKQLEQKLGGSSPRTPSLSAFGASPQRENVYRRQLLHGNIVTACTGNPRLPPREKISLYFLSTAPDPLDPHSELEGDAPDGSFANRYGRHAVGHVDDFNALQQQVLEGRSIVQTLLFDLYHCGPPKIPVATLRQILEEAASLLKMFWRAALPSADASTPNLKKSMQEEILSLKLRVSEQEEVLKGTIQRLRSTSRTKESMEHFIVNQRKLQMKKSGTNLAQVGEKFWTKTNKRRGKERKKKAEFLQKVSCHSFCVSI
uniref:Uncharacterized protein n=1 Tax=Hippocampus comes TaxID=109280 RepID=A0A3Q2XAB0_HIPCM